MPELPEVETLCRQLRNTVLGMPLLATRTLDDKLPDLANRIDRCIVAVDRRGKNLLLTFDDEKVLAVHLRMTGRLLWQTDATKMPPYTRLTMLFAAGTVFFIDPRRFMTLTWGRTFPANCGPEPFPDLEPSYLPQRGKTRKGPIKTFLLDQTVIAGIGNIYACEMLYAAGIAPERATSSLRASEWRRLQSAVHEILDKAVTCRGTSVSDWRDFHGHEGCFQNELHVYRKGGLSCPRCGQAIARITTGGRGTYFCPGCQK